VVLHMRLTAPSSPPAPGSRASILHAELATLRALRDDDPRRFFHRLQSLRDCDAHALVALALVTERWSDAERAAVTVRPDADTDPRTTRAFRRFLADDRRHNKGAA